MWYKLGILGVLFSATQSLLAVCSMGESPVANPQVIAVGIHGGLFLMPPANSSLSEWWMEIPASFLGNFAGAGDARMLCCHKCPQTQNQVLWSGLSSLLADSRLVLFYFLGVKTLSFSCQFRKILLSSSPVLSPIGICSLSLAFHTVRQSQCAMHWLCPRPPPAAYWPNWWSLKRRKGQRGVRESGWVNSPTHTARSSQH